MYQIFHTTLLWALLTQCMGRPRSSALVKWHTVRLPSDTDPVSYLIPLQNVDTEFPAFRSRRSIIEIVERPGSLLAALVKRVDTTAVAKRLKRALPRANSIDGHLKANLRYHHQQRHPNGSVTGSYGETDPAGQLQAMRYVKDGAGYREFPDSSHVPSAQVNIISKSNFSNLPTELAQIQSGIPKIRAVDGAATNLIPNMALPYITPPLDSIGGSPIIQSAIGSVSQFAPKSPLFDKYYRPSLDEIQRTYDYHRMRTVFDPDHYRPKDATPIPDIPPDKQPELRSVYNEYQVPYQARFHEPSLGYVSPTYSPSLSSPGTPYVYQHGVHPQNPYPQTVQPQNPIYLQSYEGQSFVPASAYNGPYGPNTATFNQPYPSNIPIYTGSLQQNLATNGNPAHEPVPMYLQAPILGPNYSGQQPVYYASASNLQPLAMSRL